MGAHCGCCSYLYLFSCKVQFLALFGMAHLGSFNLCRFKGFHDTLRYYWHSNLLSSSGEFVLCASSI